MRDSLDKLLALELEKEVPVMNWGYLIGPGSMKVLKKNKEKEKSLGWEYQQNT